MLVLQMVNACLATVLAALLVGLASGGSDKKVGWAGVALVNTVGMGMDLMLLMNWWVRLEGSMGSIRRIIEYVSTAAPDSGNADANGSEGRESSLGKVEFRDVILNHGYLQAQALKIERLEII